MVRPFPPTVTAPREVTMKLTVPALAAMGLLLVSTGCKKKPADTGPSVGPVAEAGPDKAANPDSPPEVQEMVKNFERVFFDFDKSELGADAKAALSDNVAIMQKYTDLRIEVQGHADERGTTDYNIALGQRRAESVTSYMKAQGISASRIKVVSYGEERPLDERSNERAWSKNRRCEFVITWSGEAPVEGTTGG